MVDFIKRNIGPIGLIIALLVGGLLIWKGKNWIGDRWADHKHEQAMEELAKKQKEVDAKNAKIDELRGKLQEELNQGALQQQETQTLKELAEAKGKDSAALAKKTEEAFNQYEESVKTIDQYSTDYDICVNVTCPIRARNGYACRPGFCDQFSRAPRDAPPAP